MARPQLATLPGTRIACDIILDVSPSVPGRLLAASERGLNAYRGLLQPEFTEQFRISGIEIELTGNGEVWAGGVLIGRVSREQRFDQWFWRAHDSDSEIEIKRFFTSRPEAIQLLLLRAELIDGLGF